MSARVSVRKSDLDKLAAVLTDRGQVVGRVEMKPDGTVSMTALTAIPQESPDAHPSDEWKRRINGETRPPLRTSVRGQARTDAALLQAQRLANRTTTG